MSIIIKNICLLLEMLSITMCLHQLYGEKYRLDIATVSLLAMDMIMMQTIDYFELSNMVSVLIYPIMAIYCGIKFGFKLKPIIVNIVLCVGLVGTIQMIGTLLVYYLYRIYKFSDFKLLLVNCIAYIFVIVILSRLKVYRLSKYLQKKEKTLFIAICCCLLVALFIIISYKRVKFTEVINSIILFSCILFIAILAMNMMRYKLKSIEIETELKMHKLYSKSFQGLIDNIKLKQHEFDNHINAIYSQHFSYHTYEELVDAQKSYCEHIVKDNRFNKLLSQNNSIIRGFLYTRFIEADRMGIDVSYYVNFDEFNIEIPIYKLIEVLGDLINNAVEALMADGERNKLHVSIIETDGFYLEVRNESSYISYDILETFFNKGYSKKGKNRGLGLYNVKQICDEYGLKVFCENEKIDEINWLSFKLQNKKDI